MLGRLLLRKNFPNLTRVAISKMVHKRHVKTGPKNRADGKINEGRAKAAAIPQIWERHDPGENRRSIP
jgi:hypothetical protein